MSLACKSILFLRPFDRLRARPFDRLRAGPPVIPDFVGNPV